MDIEGSEYEVFNEGPLDWLADTRAVIVEPHDHLNVGCSEKIIASCATCLPNVNRSGEYIVLSGRNTIVAWGLVADAVPHGPGQPAAAARGGWLFVIPWDLGEVGGVNEVVKALYREAAGSGRDPLYCKLTGPHARCPGSRTRTTRCGSSIAHLGPGDSRLRLATRTLLLASRLL